MTPKKHRIVLIGFGTVAQGLCHILHDKKESLLSNHNFDFELVGVSTRSRGTMYHPQGLSLSHLLELAKSKTPFTENVEDWNSIELIEKSNATVVVELTHTDLQSGEPAVSHCRAAFTSGKHVVTGNKGPAALAYAALNKVALQNQVFFLNEATVLSGTPVFSLYEKTLSGNTIHQVRGILNGTTNFILSEMEADASYQQALEVADNMGYLEADKAADVEGYDAQAKLTILANVLLGIPLQLEDVKVKGITEITVDDIKMAMAENKRWRLIGSLMMREGRVFAEVKPEKLPLTDPLAQVTGTTNSITFSTDLLGDVTITGPGAGSIETGYSILSDLLMIHRGESS